VNIPNELRYPEIVVAVGMDEQQAEVIALSVWHHYYEGLKIWLRQNEPELEVESTAHRLMTEMGTTREDFLNAARATPASLR
jgi:hypothetical protein